MREVRTVIDPYLAHARARERQDAEVDPALFGFDFQNLRIRVRRMLTDRELRTLVDRFGSRINRANREQMLAVLGIDLLEESPIVLAELETLRRANVVLIRSIGTRLLDDVFRVVTESVINGTRVEALARQIEERFSVSEGRARTIARDQTLTANAQLTQTRHREAGVASYVWSASRDEKVRDIHAELDGFEFRWDDPPVTDEYGNTNHPGEDINCRCVAIPVLRDDDE